MRTIIAGSRSATDPKLLQAALKHCTWKITTVLCGGASGVDALGRQWARDNGIPVEFYLADWDKYGKSAGMVRNAQMAENAEALVALWDGESKGTANMITNARRKNLKICTYIVNG